MVAFTPFEPALGKTQQVAIGSGSATSQIIQVTSSLQPAAFNSVLCSFAGATAGTAAYVRISVESSTTITATNGDCPMLANGSTPTVRLFACPEGNFNIAVVVTATPATAGTMWFTPGQGGDI